MADKKIVPINYTNRDFGSIKAQLVEYAKRYYPDTYKDFTQASFGSMMLDTVSYVGDILSFYLDYQANESNLTTALERKNVLNEARSRGFKFNNSPTASGIGAFYIAIPGTVSGPNANYIPILQKGTQLGNNNGISFILNEDIDFSESDTMVSVGQVDQTTGSPTSFILKRYATVISGKITSQTFSVGDFQKFLKLTLSSPYVSEILSVKDSNGNEYFEVDNLSQNIVYRAVKNKTVDKEQTPYILKPVSVPRRFTVELDGTDTIIQFGYGSDDLLNQDTIADPSSIVLQQFGKDYVTDLTFDPTKLMTTDKFGIAPSNTTITVSYRSNDFFNTNISANSLKSATNARFLFGSTGLDPSVKASIASSLEIDNEDAIVGSVSPFTNEEIKIKAIGHYSAQNRAVTKNDYLTLVYNMPSRFGAIKRANIEQDKDSFKRNMNLYVVSEDRNGNLTTTGDLTKENLKNWILNYKMINDTIDILDAKVVNIGIDFQIIASLEKNRQDVLQAALTEIKNEFIQKKFDIGEPIYLSEIYTILNKLDGVLDTVKVTIRTINDAGYSQVPFDILLNMSADGRYVDVSNDYILEVKNPNSDIRGAIF